MPLAATPSSRPHPAARRGMTLLEVVVAILILGLIASAVASVMTYTLAQQRYNELRLGAYEVANRLMIQFLDDDTTIRTLQGRPIEYNGRRFEWECQVDKVRMDAATVGPHAASYNGRYELVSIVIWRDETHTAPLATLSRLLDPAFLARNPASLASFSKDPSHVVEYSLNRLGIGANGSAAPAGARFSSRSSP